MRRGVVDRHRGVVKTIRAHRFTPSLSVFFTSFFSPSMMALLCSLDPGRLTGFGDSVPIRAVKFFVPLLAFAALALTACSTDANRRDLYRPKKADGYWTRSLEEGAYKDREVVDAQLPGARKSAEKER